MYETLHCYKVTLIRHVCPRFMQVLQRSSTGSCTAAERPCDAVSDIDTTVSGRYVVMQSAVGMATVVWRVQITAIYCSV